MKAFLLLEKNWFNLYRKPFCSLSLIMKNTVLDAFLFLEISETDLFFEFWKITWRKGEKCCSFFRNSLPPGYAFAKPSKLGVGEWGEYILLPPPNNLMAKNKQSFHEFGPALLSVGLQRPQQPCAVFTLWN